MYKGESEEAAVGIESDGRRKEIADETTQVAEINKKYKSQQKVETFFCIIGNFIFKEKYKSAPNYKKWRIKNNSWEYKERCVNNKKLVTM